MTTPNLSPAAQTALRLIRALRRLPETDGTIAAERKVIDHLRLPDINAVALALLSDDEAVTRG
jgi:hypothetical protein